MNGAAAGTIRTVRLNGVDVIDGGFEFRPGEDISGLEVEITNKLHDVTGLVTNARGETMKDYTAIAFAQDEEKWKMTGPLPGHRPARSGRPVQDLRPAARRTTTSSRSRRSSMSQSSDPEFLDAIRIKATAITIREGETRTVDLKITQAS